MRRIFCTFIRLEDVRFVLIIHSKAHLRQIDMNAKPLYALMKRNAEKRVVNVLLLNWVWAESIHTSRQTDVTSIVRHSSIFVVGCLQNWGMFWKVRKRMKLFKYDIGYEYIMKRDFHIASTTEKRICEKSLVNN